MLSVSETCTVVSCTNSMSVTLKCADDVPKSLSLDRRKTQSDFSGPGRTIEDASTDINLTRQPSFIHKNVNYVSGDKTKTTNKSYDTTVAKPTTIKSICFKRTLGIRQSWNNLWHIKRNKVKDEKSDVVMNKSEMPKKNSIKLKDSSEMSPIEVKTCDVDDNKVNDDKVDNHNGKTPKVKIVDKNHRRVQSFTTYDYWSKQRSASCVNSNRSSAPGTPITPTPTYDQLLHTNDQNILNLGLVTSASLSNNINQSHTVKADSKTITKLSSSVSVTASANNRSPSPHPLKSGQIKDVADHKPEKEKKKKELSSSRQKKFNRHFTQVSPDERILNYFSCALVSDILLQGHLYITENYFAFYSNVFGYVTKLLIPIVSVVKISKEKTAKIIPNAVGVLTADERHVFGSFMSREAAYRLMLSVWRPVAIAPTPEEEPPKIIIIPDVEASECSIEDDSSCSASGNESSSQLKDKLPDELDTIKLLQSQAITSTYDGSPRILKEEKQRELLIGTMKSEFVAKLNESTHTHSGATNTTTTTASAEPTINSTESIIKYKNFRISVPHEFNIVYLGIFLAIVLAFFSIYLMYRIYDLQSRTFSMHPYDFKLGDNMDVYAEVLRWQSQMQDKSSKEAQIILDTNLEQIAKVRKSLETLSILLHETSAKFPTLSTDDDVGPKT